MKDLYYLGAVITGLIAFIAIWLYAISSWGLLLGLAVGWFPAAIGAAIVGFLWPLIVIVFLYFFFGGR